MTGFKWTVSRRLWLLNGFLIAIFIGLGLIGLKSTSTLAKDIKELGEVHLPAIRNMTLTDMMHDGIRAVVFKAQLEADADEKTKDEILGEYKEMSDNIEKYLATIGKLSLPEELKQPIEKAMTDVKDYKTSGKTSIDLIFNKGNAEDISKQMAAFNESFEKLEESLGKIGDEIEANSQKGVTLALEDAKTFGQFMWIAMLIGFLVGATFSAIVTKVFVSQLQKAIFSLSEQSQHVGESSGSVKETAFNLAKSSEEQASAVQQTAAAVEEINSMVTKTSENSKLLVETVEESSASAQKGQNAVTEMLESMGQISDSSAQVMDQVEDNNQRIIDIVRVINEIAEKTRVINDIVFQTKLLSFNASVEAARAGEHGKGFAVVAQEVGNLAQMSGNAANEISLMLESGTQKVNSVVQESKSKLEKIINESRRTIESGKKVASNCGNALNEIVNQIGEVKQLTSEIRAAIQEQTLGLGEINSAIQLFEKVTQGSSVTAEKSAAVAENLLHQYTDLEAVISDLRSSVIGREDSNSNKNSESSLEPSHAADEKITKSAA